MQTPPPTSPDTGTGTWSRAAQQVQRVWALSKPYYFSDEKWAARGLLAAIVALNLALVYMAVLFNVLRFPTGKKPAGVLDPAGAL